MQEHAASSGPPAAQSVLEPFPPDKTKTPAEVLADRSRGEFESKLETRAYSAKRAGRASTPRVIIRPFADFWATYFRHTDGSEFRHGIYQFACDATFRGAAAQLGAVVQCGGPAMMTPVHFSNEALMAIEIAGFGDLIPDLERMADTIQSFSEEASLPPYFAKVAAEYRAQRTRCSPTTTSKWRASA